MKKGETNMQQMIDLKHTVCDFNCMLSGLEDMIESRYNFRLPPYLSFLAGYIGFKYEINPSQPIPRIVEPGYGVGRVHYRFFADIFGFEWQMMEDYEFDATWNKIKSLIDAGYPVVAGEMDMYHLPYLKKFYHRIHVPFHYITLVGYDEQRKSVYIQDCGRKEIQEVGLIDLESALSKGSAGLCKRNTIFWFDFQKFLQQEKSVKEIIKKILNKKACIFLNDRMQGITAITNLIKDFDSWSVSMTQSKFQKSLKHLVTYTCSNTPMPPQKLVFFKLEDIFLKHHGVRDRFATLLSEIYEKYSIEECQSASQHFKNSGEYFQEMTDLITDYLATVFRTNRTVSKLKQVTPLLEKIKEEEIKAFTILSQISIEKNENGL